MEQRSLDNHRCNRCKRETIRQGKSSREEQRRIGLVGIQIQCEIWRQDVGDIVKVAGVVICLRVADREVITVPGVREMDANRSDPPEYNTTNQSIGNCVPRWDKRTIGVCGDLSPIEGDWQ